MPYDPEKDEVLAEKVAWEEDRKRLVVRIRSYDGGERKVAIHYFYYSKADNGWYPGKQLRRIPAARWGEVNSAVIELTKLLDGAG